VNVKNKIKKVFAVAVSAALVGTTLAAVAAYDLSDYPAPFVEDGMFNGAIVVGETAATTDVLGAIDIAASLQAEATTPVATGDAQATTTVTGGYMIEDVTSQDLNLLETIKDQAVDQEDLDVLADGVLEDDDGAEYDYDQQIAIDSAIVVDFDRPDNNIYLDPVFFVDLENSILLNFSIGFDAGDEVDLWALNDGEAFDMFGKTFTVKNIGGAEDDEAENVLLYGSDLTEIVTMGTPLEVEVDGDSFTIEILGANADSNEVHVAVNGEARSLSEGETKTISGLEIYVKEVFISNIAGESAAAAIFLGSIEYDLGEVMNDTNALEMGGEEIEGVEVVMTGSQYALERIDFLVTPDQILNADLEEDYDWLAMGDMFIDPVFGFSLELVEEVPGVMASSKDYVSFSGAGDALELSFTNTDGAEYGVELFAFNSTGENFTQADDFVNVGYAGGISILDNGIFIVEEASASTEPVSRIIQFTGTSGSLDDEANFEDLGNGDSWTLESTDFLADSEYVVTINGEDDISLDLPTKTYVITASGLNISGIGIEDLTGVGVASITLTIDEDAMDVNSDENLGGAYDIVFTPDTTDNEIDMTTVALIDAEESDDDGDYTYGITDFGTYMVHESDENSMLELWVPMEDTVYNLYLAPPTAVKILSGASGDAFIVNPIALGLGVLDTDVTLGSKPMIVVGGPYVNNIAAELLGNPDAETIEATFTAGKAMIRYFDGSQAMLVAGYSAMDTQGASYVVANYNMYNLVGSEVEVVVTDLNNIVVN